MKCRVVRSNLHVTNNTDTIKAVQHREQIQGSDDSVIRDG